MSYASKRSDYGKEHIYVVEIDLDTCANTYGVAPCTATGSGDGKCYNTFATCQDLPNYAQTTKTYRYCQERSPHPVAIDAIPSLKTASLSPSQIDLKGGLGVRASSRIVFDDHPHSDNGEDPYLDDRTYDPIERGTYWTKLRARNPNYQNRPLRVLSGYLNRDGSYDAANFLTRHYVIDSMDASGGVCSITAKDPLKLAMRDKAQAPEPSTGKLAAPITDSATSATLQPPGVGDEEYTSSGKILIGKEVMSFTRSGDTLTLTRAQNNTTASSHAVSDTVQLCLEYSAEGVANIVFDLLTTYAKIPASFIPEDAWLSEQTTFLPGALSAIIVKPHDVFKLLKELSEAAPHYLWWDERSQLIQFTALKGPPVGANPLDQNAHIVAGSFKTKDRPDMRVSTVYVHFGQIDPTQKLDEPANWRQTYARVSADSINAYGSNKIKTIFSRWLLAINAAGARQLAALIGRRFADVPRETMFKLEAKDGDTWLGQSVDLIHRDILDASGAMQRTTFQILSASEADSFTYKALEYTYGDELPEDEGGGVPGVDLVIISFDTQDLNLRTAYDNLFTAPPTATTEAKFIIDAGAVVSSSDITIPAIDTGTWPAGAVVTLEIKPNGIVAGRGGVGAPAVADADGGDGGTALKLSYDLTYINSGILGGGGGGGAASSAITTTGADAVAEAGGGSGFGEGALSGPNTVVAAHAGDALTGGTGAAILYFISGTVQPQATVGATGGELGQPGNHAVEFPGAGNVGQPGPAIDQNGFTLSVGVLGDTRGAILS